MTPQIWLTVAGLGTWLVCSLPAIARVLDGSFRGPALWVWCGAFLGFGVAFVALSCLAIPRSRSRSVAWLVAQSICALVLVATTSDGFAAATLVVVAGQLLWVCGLRGALIWVAVQSSVLFALLWFSFGGIVATTASGAYGGFQLFAVAASAIALRERRTAEALVLVNAELTATRELLAESSRVAERLRISRDLHDTLGHHLTALSLQLDVAARLSTGQAAEHISEAHAVARLLLGDVRDVVSRLRDTRRIDVASLLKDLAASATTLEVHLDLPEEFGIEDLSRAEALHRVVQEIVTNATRHAGAEHLWISLAWQGDGVVLHAHDDGRGSDAPIWGNGLTGMRERFAEHNGRIDVVTARGQGFAIRGYLPLGGRLA